MPHGIAAFILAGAVFCFMIEAVWPHANRVGWLGLALFAAAQYFYGK